MCEITRNTFSPSRRFAGFRLSRRENTSIGFAEADLVSQLRRPKSFIPPPQPQWFTSYLYLGKYHLGGRINPALPEREGEQDGGALL